jgi:hypothetical protein
MMMISKMKSDYYSPARTTKSSSKFYQHPEKLLEHHPIQENRASTKNAAHFFFLFEEDP